jgi:hypothetical protein
MKKWVTLDQACEVLSRLLNEQVSKTDIYQLSLERHVTLSINLIHSTTAKLGKVIQKDGYPKSYKLNSIVLSVFIDDVMSRFSGLTGNVQPPTNEDHLAYVINFLNQSPAIEKIEAILKKSGGSLEKIYPDILDATDHEIIKRKYIEGLAEEIISSPNFASLESYDGNVVDHPNGYDLIELDGSVTRIFGIWDLPLIGNEIVDILHNLHTIELNGPEVELNSLDGAWLKDPETDKWAQIQESFADNEYCSEEQIINYIKKPEYYPAGGLPQDAILVIRTTELQRCIDGLTEEPRSNRKTENLQQKVIRSLATALNGTLTEQPTESDAQRFIDTVKRDYGTDIPCSAKVLAKYMTSLD